MTSPSRFSGASTGSPAATLPSKGIATDSRSRARTVSPRDFPRSRVMNPFLERGKMSFHAVRGADAELLTDFPHGGGDAPLIDSGADKFVYFPLPFGDGVFHSSPFCHE